MQVISLVFGVSFPNLPTFSQSKPR